jgi:hypothetical protein
MTLISNPPEEPSNPTANLNWLNFYKIPSNF